MEDTTRKFKTSKRNFILALILLLLTNTLMGITLTTMSKKTLREQIREHMTDISDTAAHQLDGDFLKNMTAEDIGTEKYQKAYEILSSFQQNIHLEYIYAIKDNMDGTFSFTIDPDPEEPGSYGEHIKTTSALVKASKGTTAIDTVSHSDRWGNFYTAYSPVFDSNGNVAGIVCVDFDADWYDSKLSSNRAAVIIITMIALTVGIVLSFVIMSDNRKTFSHMLKNLDRLSHETRKLDIALMRSSIKKLDMIPDGEHEVLKTLAAGEDISRPVRNQYDELNSSIENIYEKLQKYLEYIEDDVYIDDLTGVLNKGAYKDMIQELDEKIQKKNAAFSVAFFDINHIKKVYTNLGFEAGDKMLYHCAVVLKDIFHKQHIYHVTGDEFIVIAEGKGENEMNYYFGLFEEALQKYNEGTDPAAQLSVSKGFTTFDDIIHKSYRQVFVEAFNNCVKNKQEYYEQNNIEK
ncbi:diguanylate cyclase (GGDEF) domain-containing protein [Eubacterium ruminantium]|nr:diguanylate cyclase (GGDEF) domain-containing protein [Eubacterium ruminantium]